MLNRRNSIIEKIVKRLKIEYLGYTIMDQPSPCFIWQGPNSGNGKGGGYPRMCLNGQTVAVHLVMFTHFFGYIPGKKQIDHKCNNRLCCNPDHLEMVTHLKNQRLRVKRAKETKSLKIKPIFVNQDIKALINNRNERMIKPFMTISGNMNIDVI